MSHENDHGDVRYGFMYVGEIVDRADPEGLGRVRVRIPGLIDDKTGWAFPLGFLGGGGNQRGFKMVPPLHAEVGIFFKGGDPDCPYYIPAQYGQPNGESEVPTDVADAASDHPEDVHALETDAWKITLDDRPGKEALRISNKVSGDMIEFDGSSATGPGITIQASAALYLKIDGQFIVDAISAVINGRKIVDGAQNI